MRRSHIIPALLTIICATSVSAQQAGQPRSGSQSGGQQAQVDPDLWEVLKNWSEKSAAITRLEGHVVRRKYESTFGVEYLGEGYFYFESPDKGRLDLNPYEVTEQMLQARQKPDARVRRKNGKPYKLQSDQPEKWICDGLRVITMEVEKKSATVSQLPEELRGTNIMNGPMPFLFGLPPNEAVSRFRLTLVQRPTARNPYARLHAEPKRAHDAKAWKEAEVILDTRTGLPAHVKLLRPSGTLEEVYSFDPEKLKVNARAGGILELIGKNPFKVNLRGYQVNVNDPGKPVVPDLVGLPHTEAEARLKKLGLKKEQISKIRGDAAQRPEDVYHVQDQVPKPGTPIDGSIRVSMRLWTRA